MRNKRWEQNGERHNLLFTPYYDETVAAELYFNEEFGWAYDSEVTDASVELLTSETLESAKEDVESIIAEHYQGEINYYTEILSNFVEE